MAVGLLELISGFVNDTEKKSWESVDLPRSKGELEHIHSVMQKCFTKYGGLLRTSIEDSGISYKLKCSRVLEGKFALKSVRMKLGLVGADGKPIKQP